MNYREGDPLARILIDEKFVDIREEIGPEAERLARTLMKAFAKGFLLSERVSVDTRQASEWGVRAVTIDEFARISIEALERVVQELYGNFLDGNIRITRDDQARAGFTYLDDRVGVDRILFYFDEHSQEYPDQESGLDYYIVEIAKIAHRVIAPDRDLDWFDSELLEEEHNRRLINTVRNVGEHIAFLAGV